jgi:hypothetical protein
MMLFEAEVIIPEIIENEGGKECAPLRERFIARGAQTIQNVQGERLFFSMVQRWV